jgi:hypothetical protein
LSNEQLVPVVLLYLFLLREKNRAIKARVNGRQQSASMKDKQVLIRIKIVKRP